MKNFSLFSLCLAIALSTLSCSSARTQHCSDSEARGLAKTMANDLQPLDSLGEKAKVCGEVEDYTPKRFIAIFTKAFDEEMREVCVEKKMKALAAKDANSSPWKPTTLEKIANCSDYGDEAALRSAYSNAFNKRMSLQCDPIGAGRAAAADAKSGVELEEGLERFRYCSQDAQYKILSLYTAFYNREASKIENKKREDMQNMLLSQRSFEHAGKAFETTCRIDNGKAVANVYPSNAKDSASFNGRFIFEYIDQTGRRIDSQSSTLYVAGHRLNNEATDSSIPAKTYRCVFSFDSSL